MIFFWKYISLSNTRGLTYLRLICYSGNLVRSISLFIYITRDIQLCAMIFKMARNLDIRTETGYSKRPDIWSIPNGYILQSKPGWERHMSRRTPAGESRSVRQETKMDILWVTNNWAKQRWRFGFSHEFGYSTSFRISLTMFKCQSSAINSRKARYLKNY